MRITKDDNKKSITPVQYGNRYLNYPEEAIWWQFLVTLYLLFVGLRREPTLLGDRFISTLCIMHAIIPEKSKSANITWLGHATSLIQIEEMNILIDPNFSDWTPPVFHRYTPPGIRREYLPKINLLLLSHNHADHAIPDDLRYLAEHHDPVVIVGRGSRLWLEQFGFTNIIEADWWDELMLEDDSITITAIPAQHGSQTTLTNLNKMLWCGFMIQSENETIYYTGDTAIGHEMRNRELEKTALFPQVHERFPQIDTLLLPIAPDGEENVHINHVQACSAIQLLQPKTVIPIHHATLRTGAERVEEPIINFMREAENKALTNIVPLKIGGSHPAPNTQHCISQTLWKKQSEPSTNPNPATLEPKVI